MFDLFVHPSHQQYGKITYAEFDYLRVAYLRELGNIENYYHNRVYAVKSNHFLANLLTHLNVPMQYETEQYVNVATTRAPYLANAMRMTSVLDSGQLFDGVFYGPGCAELLLVDDSYFNPFYAELNWERICAVKVLLHPKSDLALLLPNGKVSGTEKGLAVLSINIPLLALQYRCFVQRQAKHVEGEIGQLGLSHFIHMFVLPNILYSHIDIAIQNRLMNITYQAPMGEAILKHPFPVYDYRHRIDRVLTKVNNELINRDYYFEEILRFVPSISSDSMQQALMMPDVAPTRQIQWAMLLSRLPIMAWMVEVVGGSGLGRNRSQFNALQKTLKRIQRENIYQQVLPEDLAYDTELTIERLLAA